MLTFDSITLVPAFSNITSRSTIDTSFSIKGRTSVLPIINANMLAICSVPLVNSLSDTYNTFSSYHRFFKTDQEKEDELKFVHNTLSNKNLFWASIGVQKYDYDFVGELIENGITNIIVDVNHGHHSMVSDILSFIRKNFSDDILVMAGNVSSNDGIKYLINNGADIVKIGNSFGGSCTTKLASGFGVHPLHVAKTYREETGDMDAILCLDGGIRNPSDICKSLIWGNMAMVGSMFAGCDQSACEKIMIDGKRSAKYFGNASIITKTVAKDENHVRNVEGTVKFVDTTGDISNTVYAITDGIQSSLSFVGCRNLEEFSRVAPKQVLML